MNLEDGKHNWPHLSEQIGFGAITTELINKCKKIKIFLIEHSWTIKEQKIKSITL